MSRERKATPTNPHHRILSLELTGGFLDGAKLELSDGLNCIIGGRGAGKTTVLELMRFALAGSERTSTERARATSSLIQKNLGGGRLRLAVETKHGIDYVAERSWGGPPTIKDDSGRPAEVTLDRDLVFKADVYSQNEIEEIATNPDAQLALLDTFEEEKIRDIVAEGKKVVRELVQNGAELMALEREATDREEGAAEASHIEKSLASLEPASGADGEALKVGHERRAQREREKATLQALSIDLLPMVASRCESAAAEASRALAAHLDVLEKGPSHGVLAETARAVRELATQLDAMAASVRERCREIGSVLEKDGHALEAEHAKQEAAFLELLARTRADRSKLDQRTALERRYLDAVSARRALDAIVKRREGLLARRRELLSRASRLRDERFAIRQGIAKRLSERLAATGVTVSVSQGGHRPEYHDLLVKALAGSNLKYQTIVERLVARLRPDELASFLRRGDVEKIADRTELEPERVKKYVETFQRKPELPYELEVVRIDDVPRIELRDGSVNKQTADLSTGQKCTAILPILLMESERPLLIDQPEDNLDNKFIYDTIVETVRHTKTRRQLIFVTHNPNIPVLGDAERVFVLASDGKRARVEKSGSVDELKSEIQVLLEGGKKAFKDRMERYGY